MGAPVLHLGATVLCAHGGQALPATASSVVMVSGMPLVTVAAPYSIAGCGFVPPAGNGPCVTGQWMVGAVQVVSQGQPVALLSSTGTCVPTGTPLMPVTAQMQVLAT